MRKSLFRHGSLRFRQFCNKGYACFLSLHREVTIGRVSHAIADLELLKHGRSLATFVLLCCSVFRVSASESGDGSAGVDSLSGYRQVGLQEVLVVSQKTEVHSEAFRLVSRLSCEEIASLPVRNISEILTYLPGLDVRSRGANGAQTDLSMRGGTFDQVLVLVNGVPLNDNQTGHYNLNLPLPLSLIERVEVLEGGSAGRYASYAFSGAVNFVTRKVTDRECNLSLTGGMNGLVNPVFTFAGGSEKASFNVGAEYLRSDGYYAPSPSEKEKTALENSDLRLANVFLQGRIGDFDLQAGAQYKDAGAGIFYGFGSLDQFDATRTAFASVRYGHSWKRWSLDAQAAYRANYDRYEWHRGHRQYGNFHFSQTALAAVTASYSYGIGKTSFGAEVRNENIHSTNLGDTVNPSGQIPNVEGFALKDLRVLDLVRGKNRLNVNAFARQDFFWRDFSGTLSVNANWNSMFGFAATGGADLGWHFAPESALYLNATRTMRQPTFTDLYYNAGNQLGSIDLRPEEAWTLSVGTKYSAQFGQHRLTATADVYYRWGRNIIDWVYVESDAKRPYHAKNEQSVDAVGGEVSVCYSFGRRLRRLQASYAYTRLDLDLRESCSRYLDCLSHKLVLQSEQIICFLPNGFGHIGAVEALRFQKREGEFNDITGAVQSYRPVCLLDFSLYWRQQMVKVSADCTNLTNRRYYDLGGILMPGAWAKLTVSVSLISPSDRER